MNEFIYALIKDPSKRNLRINVKERYETLYRLTENGTIPVRFKVKSDGRIKYDDKLADLAGMSDVVTKTKYIEKIIPHKIRKQYLLPL